MNCRPLNLEHMSLGSSELRASPFSKYDDAGLKTRGGHRRSLGVGTLPSWVFAGPEDLTQDMASRGPVPLLATYSRVWGYPMTARLFLKHYKMLGTSTRDLCPPISALRDSAEAASWGGGRARSRLSAKVAGSG